MLVLVEQPDVVHQLEALEALHDAGRLGLQLQEQLLLVCRQTAAHAAARQLEVVVDVGVDTASAAPLVEGLEQRGDARVLAPAMAGSRGEAEWGVTEPVAMLGGARGEEGEREGVAQERVDAPDSNEAHRGGGLRYSVVVDSA